MLPLGVRVQDKVEKLIEKHMSPLGASKLSLSSLSSQALWEKSGRLQDSEIFKFLDRKESRLLLAPTHEEEITRLVGGLLESYKELPLRVYQISRKYRDELRPRQGLLRGREFIMKDLYTFDYNTKDALETYESVRQAYVNLFDELKLPYLVAAADSGNMGGNLSHEFHFPSSKGEDTVISCSGCDNVYNEEVADGRGHKDLPELRANGAPHDESTGLGPTSAPAVSTDVRMYITEDKKSLIRAYYPKYLMQEGSSEPVPRTINSHAVRSVAQKAGFEVDLSVENPLDLWKAELNKSQNRDGGSTKASAVLDIYDSRVRPFNRPPLGDLLENISTDKTAIQHSKLDNYPGTDLGLDLVGPKSGDKCPSCATGVLKIQTAVEMGHTFFLGTRYTEVLQANIAVDPSLIGNKSSGSKGEVVPLQMGCHGIGVSRMISAVADCLSDSKGLNWPRAMAPYEVVVVPTKGLEQEAEYAYDALTSEKGAPQDTILDDRKKELGWKLGDADLIGYPVIVVVGKGWKREKKLEVQCRRLDGFRKDVSLEELPGVVRSLLNQL
ncbi:hypothetical protein FQN54_001381 [Arachnomyces sp. PD_36]|nr:hypothetical protein FQN54_001381 [Arachnomyces sp. PD_36]